jgi:glyceraldehyde-3-phosphate dehydrogenase (NADP+)
MSQAPTSSSPSRLFIAGAFVDGAHVQPVRSPWDGRIVSDVHRADAALVDRALAHGAAAVPVMAALPAHARAEVLRGVASRVAEQKDVLATTIVAEAGKPLRYARLEVERAVETFSFAADVCGRLGDEAIPFDAAVSGVGRYGVVRRLPVGLVAAVSPFNFPLNLVAHKLAPAFAAGCPVVLKPASQTPLTALKLASICREAGLPDGGLSVVPCDRRAADLLVTDDRPRLLTFTGSAAVGWDMKARAGRKRVVLELGGDAAAVILDDADLESALPRVVAGAFAYAGQVCISVQRVLVQRRRYAEARQRLVELTRATAVGDPTREDVVCGPLVDDDNAARVEAVIAEARAGGATVLCGGEREGRVLRPALLEGAPADGRFAREEIFGPVASLSPFDEVDDAIRQVNASRYGLQAGVFTDSLSSLWRFFSALEVGAVIHDDAPTFRVDHMPYGGVKDSGFGREGLPSALADYTEPRLLALKP